MLAITTNELGALGLIGFVTLQALAGYLGLWMECREQQRQVKRPTGTGGEVW